MKVFVPSETNYYTRMLIQIDDTRMDLIEDDSLGLDQLTYKATKFTTFTTPSVDFFKNFTKWLLNLNVPAEFTSYSLISACDPAKRGSLGPLVHEELHKLIGHEVGTKSLVLTANGTFKLEEKVVKKVEQDKYLEHYVRRLLEQEWYWNRDKHTFGHASAALLSPSSTFSKEEIRDILPSLIEKDMGEFKLIKRGEYLYGLVDSKKEEKKSTIERLKEHVSKFLKLKYKYNHGDSFRESDFKVYLESVGELDLLPESMAVLATFTAIKVLNEENNRYIGLFRQIGTDRYNLYLK